MFGIILVGMHLASCKKDVKQQVQQATPSENKAQLFEKSLTVYSADKALSTTLHIKAATPELLNKVSSMKFTLSANVQAPKSQVTTLPADEGIAAFSKGVTLLPHNVSTPKPDLSEKAIQIEAPDLPKVANMALNVSSADEAVAAGPADIEAFFYRSGWHYIEVLNRHRRSIGVDFYSFFRGQWRYSGYSFELFRNQSAWFQHCSRTVGADVFYVAAHNFTVFYVHFC